jgi:prevent-host-death family protein
MRQINMHEAKTHLSSLVKEAAAGEPFIIAIDGSPKVKVVPFDNKARTPRVGFLKGYGAIPDDFDGLGRDEIAEMFEG